MIKIAILYCTIILHVLPIILPQSNLIHDVLPPKAMNSSVHSNAYNYIILHFSVYYHVMELRKNNEEKITSCLYVSKICDVATYLRSISKILLYITMMTYTFSVVYGTATEHKRPPQKTLPTSSTKTTTM